MEEEQEEDETKQLLLYCSFIIGRWSAAAGDIESSSLGIAFDSVGDEE